MLNPNSTPLKATTSTTEGLSNLNNLNIPPTTTRSTSNPILPSVDGDRLMAKNESKNQTKSANQINKLENTNISIENESTATYSPSSVNLEHNSFFSRNYNESLIRLLSNGKSGNQAESSRANSSSMLNNLKSLSGSILNTIQRPFQNLNHNGGGGQFESSHTCNLGYRLNNNLNDMNSMSELNRTSTEPLIDTQIANDNQYYFSSRYQQFANDSPSFSASSSNNFSFNTVSTNLTSVNSRNNLPLNDCVAKNDEQSTAAVHPTEDLNGSMNPTAKKIASTPGANLLNNNIFKLNLDNIQNDDEQNAFNNMTASLSNKQLTIYEKRYLLAVERGDLAGVRRMIEMAPQIEQQEKEKGDYNGPVFNINCTDPIGRSALLMAIDNENLDMIELLVECGVEMRDSLLHAINEEFVEAVELLLDYEEALQRNKRTALEAEKPNEDDAKTMDDKPINFSFDFRPTLLQNNKENDPADKNGTNATSSTSQTNSNSAKLEQKVVKPANQQVQNGICNKLSLNSNSSNSSNKHSAPASIPIQPILYSWEGFERETFTADVTPLILAAHKNNYEIIKLLLDRGISK